MSTLSTHSSSKTQILEILFPEGKWKDLLNAILWECVEKLGDTKFSFKLWGIRITVPTHVVHLIVAALAGPKSN